jgi:hemoglobin-like flavoprotein
MSLLPEVVLEQFHDSYERLRDNPQFLDLLYERFLNSSEEIAKLFAHSDLPRVKKMVRDSLIYKLIASDGSAIGIKKLQKLAEQHLGYGVKHEHYDLWLDCLMTVVEELDPRYNQHVDKAWRAVMGIGISVMKGPPEQTHLSK